MTKRAANGSPLVYEYWRGSWTDAEKRRHSVNLGNVEVTTRAQARARLLAAIKADRKPTAEQVTVADWTQQHIDRMDAAPETVSQYTIARLVVVVVVVYHAASRDFVNEWDAFGRRTLGGARATNRGPRPLLPKSIELVNREAQNAGECLAQIVNGYHPVAFK